ncbi:MAG: hypothetical protein H7844_15890 [Nitrospirae bacterium YQR-1]
MKVNVRIIAATNKDLEKDVFPSSRKISPRLTVPSISTGMSLKPARSGLFNT